MVSNRIDDRDAAQYPPHVLREYALLADGERGALVGPRGDMVWMCAPRWDSDAVFSALIGGGGMYAVTPADARFVWGGYYEDGTLIWRSRWITETGMIECREALAFPGDADRVVVLRRIIASEGEARVRVRAGRPGRVRPASGRADWTGSAGCGPARPASCGCAGPAARRPGPLPPAAATARAGDGAHDARGRPPRPGSRAIRAGPARTVPGARRSLAGDRTHLARPACPDFAGAARPAGHPACLRGAARADQRRRRHGRRGDDEPARACRGRAATTTTATSGSATSASPARPSPRPARTRCWTTRYGSSAPGFWTTGRSSAPPTPPPAAAFPDQRSLHLPGYPGGHDIVGNHVNAQFQLDAFGESLLLLAAAAGHDHLDADGWRAVETAADAIAARWHDPEAGIWELDDQRWATAG